MSIESDELLRDEASLLYILEPTEFGSILDEIAKSSIDFFNVSVEDADRNQFEEKSRAVLANSLGLQETASWGHIFDELISLRSRCDGFMFTASSPPDLSLNNAARVLRILVSAGHIWKMDGKPFLILVEQSER